MPQQPQSQRSNGIHAKAAGSGAGGAIGLIIDALLQGQGTHLSPSLAGAITLVSGLLAAILAPPKTIPVPRPRRKPKRKPIPHTRPFAMFDSITVGTVQGMASTSGEGVAGYIDGHWPDFRALAKAFPHDWHLSIAVTARDDADCLDIETGDATPSEAASWVKRQRARGVKRPCLYANLSTMPAVRANLDAAGLPRGVYRLWVAQWTFSPHIPDGYDACQWTDHAGGRNLDESLCQANFFD